MLEFKNVNVSYGGTQVLWDINLTAKDGEVVSIVGSNGAGKTTIARALSGLVHVKSGEILFNGENIQNLPSHEILARGVVQVPEGRQLFREMTVYENLELGAFNKEAQAHMKESLETVYSWFPKLKERASQLVGTLSGGEQQMVAMSRGYMSMPKLLLMDEPSLGLAPNIVDQILNVAKELSQKGITVVLVEQDVRKALKISDRGYVIENGVMRLEGAAKDLLENEDVKKAYLGFE